MSTLQIDFPLQPEQILKLGIDDAVNYLPNDTEASFIEKINAGYGNDAIVEKWNDLKPATQEERDRFYRSTIEYIYDLVPYNAWADTLKRYEMVLNTCGVPPVSVLDFGGGIGTLSVILHRHGADVSYFDLRGVISDFARHRLAKHGVTTNVFLDKIEVINKVFDVIVCFDVLEHLENPVAVVLKLKKLLNPGGRFFIFAPFSATITHPMHLKENGIKYFRLEDFDKELETIGIIKTDEFIYERSKPCLK